MNMNSNPSVRIRVHGLDGSIETFVQHEASLVKHLLSRFQAAKSFAQERITIVGGYSITTFISSQLIRIDLINAQLFEQNFPRGIVDAVELTGAAFRAFVFGPQFRERPKHGQRESTRVFLDVAMVTGMHSFLAMELEAGSAADQINGLHLRAGLSFRMRSGGISLLNFANLARLTIHPRPSQAPSGSWFAHHPNCPEDSTENQVFEEVQHERLRSPHALVTVRS